MQRLWRSSPALPHVSVKDAGFYLTGALYLNKDAISAGLGETVREGDVSGKRGR